MAKAAKAKKVRAAQGRHAQGPDYTPAAQELRALLRRVPDGFQATLAALAGRQPEERERVMIELVRGMGREILPLIRAAALGQDEGLSCSALRALPAFGTRAAGDVLLEVFRARPDGEPARLAVRGARALQAMGIHVDIPDAEPAEEETRLTLRETLVTAPDGAGSRSVVARLQDRYGVWHAIFVMWNEVAGVKDVFTRPVSRQEWAERMELSRGGARVWEACPPEYARWLVHNARRLNEQTGFPLEEEIRHWDRHLGPPEAGYEPPDARALLGAADEAQQAQWLSESASLLEGDAGRWFLEAADCADWARRWEDELNIHRYSRPDDSQQDLSARLAGEAARELVTARERLLYRDRLLELGRLFHLRGETAEAGRAAAAALALDAGVDAAEHPFLITMVEQSLVLTTELLRRGENLEEMRYRPMRRYQSRR